MDGPGELTVGKCECCKLGAQGRRSLLMAGETGENVTEEEAFDVSQKSGRLSIS